MSFLGLVIMLALGGLVFGALHSWRHVKGYRYRFAIGGVATAGWGLVHFGTSLSTVLLDVVEFAILGMLGGFFFGGLYLSWIALRSSALLKNLTIVVLSLCVVLAGARHLSRQRAVPEFRATADSTQAVIYGKNGFGELLVTYRRDGHNARKVLERKAAHRDLIPGDSIWVYWREVEDGRKWDVWPLGPDVPGTSRRVLLVSSLWLSLIVGYGRACVVWWRDAETPLL